MRYFIAISLLVVTSTYSGAQTSKNADDSVPCQTPNVTISDKLALSITRVNKDSSQWEIEVEIVSGSEDLFIAGQARRSNGSYGPYLNTSGKEGSTLHLAEVLYEGPKYFLYRNQTGIKLQKVSPHCKIIRKYVLQMPLVQTMPPFEPILRKNTPPIDTRKLISIEVEIGYFSSIDSLENLIEQAYKSRPFFDGYFVGKELVGTGNQNLIGTQRFARTRTPLP